MKKALLLLLFFIVIGGCATSMRISDERDEKWYSKHFGYLNRIDQDFWSKIHSCVVYIIRPTAEKHIIKTELAGDQSWIPTFLISSILFGPIGGAAVTSTGPVIYKEDPKFERELNDYLKSEKWNTEDNLIKLLKDKPLLSSNIPVDYVIVTTEDLLQTQWNEADAYIILEILPGMPSEGGWGNAKLTLVFLGEITILPNNSISNWKHFRSQLEQSKKKTFWDIRKERKKVISQNKDLGFYDQIVMKSTAYYDKKTWISNDGKFFKEKLQDVLISFTERIRQKVSSIK